MSRVKSGALSVRGAASAPRHAARPQKATRAIMNQNTGWLAGGDGRCMVKVAGVGGADAGPDPIFYPAGGVSAASIRSLTLPARATRFWRVWRPETAAFVRFPV